LLLGSLWLFILFFLLDTSHGNYLIHIKELAKKKKKSNPVIVKISSNPLV
jgi:hypothetical protein